MASLGDSLDQVAAIFATSRLKDELMRDVRFDKMANGEIEARTYMSYESGEIDLFFGRGKTVYDAVEQLAKNLRIHFYGESKLDSFDSSKVDYFHLAATMKPPAGTS